jgi:hypothetical protein
MFLALISSDEHVVELIPLLNLVVHGYPQADQEQVHVQPPLQLGE